ncbi:hypothetical protein ACFY0Z_28905 [Streptomyces kronopolitis]|uniref:hypothetical protein n=1 Tax=Streptomyces kronopolitis TaxID=1612435 RepID=UPI00368F8C12
MVAPRHGSRRAAEADEATAPPPLTAGSRSLRAMLPESYREGDFADRFIAGFDDVLAPLIETLDCLAAYFGPRTAPADFLEWMLSWTGTQLPDAVDVTGRRNAMLLGQRLHGLRGTRAGLELLAREVLHSTVQITESGGTFRSQRPEEWRSAGDNGTSLPWADVRLRLSSAGAARFADRGEDIDALIREWIPAHITSWVSVSADSCREQGQPEGVN